MSVFSDSIIAPTITAIRSTIIGYAASASLAITNWKIGSTGQQLFETFAETTELYTRTIARAIRGFASLDLATDPGDPDPYEPGNAALSPERGFLSHWGENQHGTTREEATFASGQVTFINNGPGARTISPGALVFTWTANSPPTPAPTYRNSPDATIYTGPGGTVTIPAGTSLPLPVSAEEIGTRSSVASASSLSLTTTLAGCTATNAAAILGSDREDAAVYRARSRLAMARLSLAGAAGIYTYLAAKNLDGSPLLNALGAASSITRTYESEDSATGKVDTYYANDSGGAAVPTADVTAANLNISSYAYAVPGAVTFGPSGTGGTKATDVSIHIQGTAKIKAVQGFTNADLATAARSAIVAALAEYFKAIPIGGVDQTAGVGVVYTDDLQAVASQGYPGLYNALVSLPAGASTAIALGHVATLNSSATLGVDWAITVTP